MKLIQLFFLVILRSVYGSTVPAECQFTELVNHGYSCVLENVILNNADDSIVISGSHSNAKSDEDVVAVVFYENSKLIRVPSEVFEKFVNLKKLIAGNCKISKITKTQFDYAERLEYLDLQFNEIPSLETGIFERAWSLNELHLSNNSIKTIKKDAFSGLRYLQILNIANNSIDQLISDAFKGMPNLRGIFLKNNKISSINSDGFRGLPSLVAIDISFNQLTELKSNWFRNSLNLKYLDVSGNRIEILENLDKANKATLEIFLALDNRINKIYLDFFGGMPFLKKIGLAGNLCVNKNFSDMKILSQTLPVLRRCFDNYHSTSSLMICSMENGRRGHFYCNIRDFNWMRGMSTGITEFHGNWTVDNSHVVGVEFINSKITEIPETMCRNFQNLEYLYVNNTNLSTLFSTTNYICTRLRYLYASDNQITRLEARGFQNQDWLNDIRLNRNQIAEIHPNAFEKLKYLKYLDLSHNKIKSIAPSTFSSTELKQLKLNDNQLKYFDTTWMTSSLISLDLGNNEIIGVREIYFKNVLDNLRDLNMEKNVCISKNYRFWGLAEVDFIVQDFENCFKNC